MNLIERLQAGETVLVNDVLEYCESPEAQAANAEGQRQLKAELTRCARERLDSPDGYRWTPDDRDDAA